MDRSDTGRDRRGEPEPHVCEGSIFHSQESPGSARRANGAGRGPGPQALALLGMACALSWTAACGSAPAPRTPTPTPVPADAPRLEAVPEEPGVERRPLADRRGIDVHAYDLQLDLSDLESGVLRGVATLRVSLADHLQHLALDLAGLTVTSVQLDGASVGFDHRGGRLEIGPLPPDVRGARQVRIAYHGSPRDGLFFGPDANGDPTAFADNWPNRARWWFPANDHPSDKAIVRYQVRVPSGYQVIANGRSVEVRDAGDTSTWVWETDPEAPIPTYTMVIGVARFESRVLGRAACGRAPAGAAAGCAEVSVWALAGDGAYGEERFRRAPDMLDFYTELIGPYPYEKLAHVESSTRFGGMENASAIFYGRGGWETRRMGENVIAHETAHQWFGDAVTPASWYQLWVSEGFASYFAPLYFEARDGPEAFRAAMDRLRSSVVESEMAGQAIIDSSTNRLFELLNANNYQKGAWVLHMLRQRLGDPAFFAGLRDYYAGHRHANADTEAVRRALERASGQDLRAFFGQWIEAPGYPQLSIEWATEGDDLVLALRQIQPAGWPTFAIDVELEIVAPDGGRRRITASMSARRETHRVPGAGGATSVSFDPDVRLLATADIRRRPD